MKPTHFLASLLALTFVSSVARAQERTTDIYRLDRDSPVYPCEITGNLLAGSFTIYETAPKGCKIQKLRLIIKENKEYYVIKILNYKKGSERYKQFNDPKSILENVKLKAPSVSEGNINNITGYNNAYFLIEKDDFNDENKVYSLSKFRKPDFTYGVITIPFKLRNGPFDVSKEVNIGTSVGARWFTSQRQPNRSIDVVIGLGLTSVAIDSLSTEGRITGSTSISTFSTYTGVVFEFSVIQVGAFLGWDNALRGNENNWRYHGKPWVGLGIGTAVFSRNTVAKSENDPQQVGKSK